MKRATLLVGWLSLVVTLLRTIPTAHAHITEPPHSPWMVRFTNGAQKLAPNEQVQLPAYSQFTPPSPLPPPGREFFDRIYDMEFPDGFTVTYAYLGSGDCTIQLNTAHCEASSALMAGQGDTPFFNADAGSLEGAYQATLRTTAFFNGSAYTDSDTVTINLVARRTADLAWTVTPGGAVIEAGKPTTLNYVLTNNGSAEAREVVVGFGSIRAHIRSISPTDACLADDFFGALCVWGTLAAGESKTIALTVYAAPEPQVEAGSFFLYATATSYENDPDISNNNVSSAPFQTHCAFFIDPSATVDTSAKIAAKGCTVVDQNAVVKAHATLEKGAYVGQNAVVKPHATLEKGAYVGAESVIGEFARLASGSVFEGQREPLRGGIGAHGSIGTESTFIGEIGAHGTVGDQVQAGSSSAFWVIVEPYATIGSRSSIRLSESWEPRVVRILAQASVPEGTVVDEAYCQRNPKICTIS
jgi:hypothetical protein